MNHDDSDLSSLSDEDYYQGDNGSQMDDDYEDQDGRGLDHPDRAISFYRMKFLTKKWTVRVILHMIDFTMSSTWLAYRNNITELGEPKNYILYYFAFRLSIANTLIHGLLKRPSPSPSLAEDENVMSPLQNAELRLIFHIKLGKCLEWLGIRIIDVGAGMKIARPLQLYNVQTASCQVIYSQFGLAIHQNAHQARRRFVEWAQNEIAVVPDFHKRILFSDEAHFWLNGYVNKQNCRIWSEANPQVYVETPLHPEKLSVWCALWAGGILLQKRGRPQRYSQW
ncbi:DDE_Tnp_1_7 domain-containing protein [Trichonephila clavipes]|nr:DDE_Tnp_1_7 domain-containing protein [Trichonephila clavipes]